MTMSVRVMRWDDLERANHIAMAAYQSPDRSKELARYLAVQPDGWLLAEVDGRGVGLGGAMDYGAFAYIGMIGVLPEYQGRGIGRAVMLGLLDKLAARGCFVAKLDASPAGAPLYAKLAFVEDDRTVVYTGKTGAQAALPSSTGDVQSAGCGRNEDAEHALAAFDAIHFGAPRQALLASYMRDDPHRTLISRDRDGTITGYLIAQPQKLGPWVAASPQSAEQLLRHALTFAFDAAPTVLVPEANVHAVALLEDCGFERTRALSHMRRGGQALPGGRQHVYGLASFAVG